MFSRPSPAAKTQEPVPEARPRTVHTPGAYPPLSVRNTRTDDGHDGPGSPVSGIGNAASATPPSPGTSSAPRATENKSSGADDTTPARPEIANSSLIVGAEVKLKGAEILDCDTLVVEGRVEATMDSRIIRIAERGAFSGKVCIDIAEIDGEFEGELTARQKLVIHATGRVRGKIRYGTLLIESGGMLSGEIESLAEAKTTNRKTLLASDTEKAANTNANVKPLLTSASVG